jgi:transcriptional regulator with XRE-family HTH domain
MSETSGAARLLRQLRQERGQSLRIAAAELGVAASHLSRLERGEKSPSGELRRRAAKYYGITEDLIALDEGRAPEDIIDILRAHPEVVDELRSRFPQEI